MFMTTRIRLAAVTGGMLLIAATASAQYKSIGRDGRVTYSDTPPPANARVVEQKKPAADAAARPALPFGLQQAATKYPVTLYTGDKCAPCDEARTFLRTRGIPFTEKTVTSDEDIALFKQQSPDGTAPVVTVGSRRSVGYSQVAWSGLLDSAGYPTGATLPRDYQNVAATPLSPNTRAAAQSVTQPAATPATRRGTTTTPTPAPTGNPSGFRF